MKGLVSTIDIRRHSISRNYGSTTIQPGTATLFFVNSDGWALTCGHVADQLAVSGPINRKAEVFRKELDSRRGTLKRNRLLEELEKKYDYSKNKTYEIYNIFRNCIEGGADLELKKHKEYDVALILFKGFTRLICDTFPIFPSDTSVLQQGKILCRLGFPFPEFTNFEYDKDKDQIKWNDTGRKGTPRFPMEGMLTRFVLDNQGNRFAFELSTPGLRGQSGGPAFDMEGKVWGMQFQTCHLDLNFDVDKEVLRRGIKERVTDSAFLHVGRCIHIDVLKTFMSENNVSFKEE